MNDEQKVTNSNSRRLDAMRIFEFLPRTLWVEDAYSLLCHVLAEQYFDDEE